DLVFPAFLFIVGMSIPFALRSRLARGEAWWKILGHVAIRAAALLMLGILMVNSESGPDTKMMGWTRTKWHALMYASAICAFCSSTLPPRIWGTLATRWARPVRYLNIGLRVLGLATLIFLAFCYRDRHDHRIITLSPFAIRTEWYGILGLIGWAYLEASIVYL